MLKKFFKELSVFHKEKKNHFLKLYRSYDLLGILLERGEHMQLFLFRNLKKGLSVHVIIGKLENKRLPWSSTITSKSCKDFTI